MSRKAGYLIEKGPASIEPQGFDWTNYLAELGAGVTISTSTYAVSPSSMTLSGASIVTGNLKTVVTLNGGSLGGYYTVTNQIATSNGVVDERSFYVQVVNR